MRFSLESISLSLSNMLSYLMFDGHQDKQFDVNLMPNCIVIALVAISMYKVISKSRHKKVHLDLDT